MKLQSRVLELVKQGIITSDEAIILIENNAKENNRVHGVESNNVEVELEKVKAFATQKETNERPLDSSEETMNEFGNAHFSSKTDESEESFTSKMSDYVKTVYSSGKVKKEYDFNKNRKNHSFIHEFYYPDISATNIDFKIANGIVQIETWDKPDFKVSAEIKLYGPMGKVTDLEAFLERSDIDVSDEKIVFHIPNKRIMANLTVYLPDKTYDYITIKLLNGDIVLDGITANDYFVKSTNGDKTFKNITGSMLEMKSINGHTTMSDVKLHDVVTQSTNGNTDISGEIHSIIASSVNSEFTFVPTSDELNNVDIKVNNGIINIDIPKLNTLEGYFKTDFGKIKSELSDVEVVRERKEKGGQQYQMRRGMSDNGHMTNVRLTMATGHMYLNDSESK